MEQSQEFESLKDSITSALVSTIRSVNALANEDIQFQRTIHPSVANSLDDTNDRLLTLANGLIKSAGTFTGVNVPILEDAEDVEIRWKNIVDVIDGLLEKADTCLDDYTGLIKRKDAPSFEAGRDSKRSKSTMLDKSLKRANIPKPQEAFERTFDNFDTEAWKPLLTRKPHAKRSFEDSVIPFTGEDQKPQYRHPYELEIKESKFPENVYELCEPIKYLPIDTTSATWVDTYEGVLEMLEELKGATEIAVDLEHHDWRTYRGLLSLMQISTRKKDWLVDTLVPWRHKLEILNEVFTDPKIVKVFHGAASDIIWLQRDLGLYIVGLFDTFHASDALLYSSKSLAFLLKKPLPEEMAFYAQCDTHFLLYIYDMVRNELIANSTRGSPESDLIERVLQRSKETALQRYENPVYDAKDGIGQGGWYNTLVRSPALYNGEQFSVYKAAHHWRDNLARSKDEHPFNIIDQNSLADIARVVPTDKKALWSLLNNTRALRDDIDDLFDTIQQARVEGANGPTLLAFLRGSASTTQRKQNFKSTEVEKIPLEQLKSKRSQLWGDMPMSSRWDPAKKPSRLDEEKKIVVHYPMPSFGANKDVETTTVQSRKNATTLDGDRRQPAVDREFTLRQGRKRKADGCEAEPEPTGAASYESEMDIDEANTTVEPNIPESEGEEVSPTASTTDEKKKVDKKSRKKAKDKAKSEDVTEVERAEKAARKAERKAEKKARKKAGKEQEQREENAEEEDATPFDYGKADSVLHAAKATGKETKGKKAFNPYGDKSGDAPKGERRMGLVKKGKTATFK
ncbi:hypothetical protein OQA88_9846 [Cercophora sp. LCS_1]